MEVAVVVGFPPAVIATMVVIDTVVRRATGCSGGGCDVRGNDGGSGESGGREGGGRVDGAWQPPLSGVKGRRGGDARRSKIWKIFPCDLQSTI